MLLMYRQAPLFPRPGPFALHLHHRGADLLDVLSVSSAGVVLVDAPRPLSLKVVRASSCLLEPVGGQPNAAI